MGKISILRVVRQYFGTLRDNRRDGVYVPDFLMQIMLPVLGSATYGVFRYLGMAPVGGGNVSNNIVAIVSIVSALLCGAAVMIFQLRFDIIDSPVSSFASKNELAIVDEIYYVMLWAIMEGFIVAGVLTVRGVCHGRAVDCVLVSVALCLFSNFCLVLMMCIKRMSKAYEFVSRDWIKARKQK